MVYLLMENCCLVLNYLDVIQNESGFTTKEQKFAGLHMNNKTIKSITIMYKVFDF